MARFQFSLRSLFWVMTMVAVFGAAAGCAEWYWGRHSQENGLLLLLFAWPSLAAIVFTCPDVSRTVRLVMYLGPPCAIFLVIWIGMVIWGGSPDAIFGPPLIVAFVGAIFWVPQFCLVFAIATFLRERKRKNGPTQTDDPSVPPQ